jgi:hypothetical protein
VQETTPALPKAPETANKEAVPPEAKNTPPPGPPKDSKPPTPQASAPPQDLAKENSPDKSVEETSRPKPIPDLQPMDPKEAPVSWESMRLLPERIVLSAAAPKAQVQVYYGKRQARGNEIERAGFSNGKEPLFSISMPRKEQPAVITIEAKSSTVEPGTYSLEIVGNGQKVIEDIIVDLPPKTEQRESPALFSFPSNLPLNGSYEEGTTLDYDLRGPENAYYTWKVNGTSVLEGQGKHHLITQLATPGDCTVSVMASLSGISVGGCQGKTKIVSKTPLHMAVSVGQEVSMDNILPPGYTDYSWSVDQRQVSTERAFVYKAQQAGTFRVDGHARRASDDSSVRSYIHAAYLINVSAS